MALAAGGSESGIEYPQPTNVNAVCQKWMVHEDNCFAEQLQSDDYEQKYDLNRFNRRTVRTDIPVARVVQSEEEVRLQQERMEQLQRNKKIEQVDEALAAKFREQELQEAELVRKKRALEDSIVAQQLLQEEMVREEFQRSELERNDARIAQQLQEKEQRRYELKKRERELIRERKRLEQEQQQRAADPQVMLAGYRKENLGGRQLSDDMARMDLGTDQPQPNRILRPDGRVEDMGDFSDFYVQPETHMKATEKKSLQELQDEELARLLQDQEHKRGAEINRDKLREIEDKDAELARVMHEEEKLKAQRRQQKRSARHHSSRNNSSQSRPDQQRQAPPGEPTRDYEDSLTDRESHLKEHRTPLPAYQDPPAYPEGRPLPETPEYANTSAMLTTTPYSRQRSSSDDDNFEATRPMPQSTEGNVFASVDPTYRNGPQAMRQSLSPQNSNPIHHSQSTNPPTLRGDDMYSNVDDIRNTGPVQAQRRSSSKRDKKSDKNGCQLQ